MSKFLAFLWILAAILAIGYPAHPASSVMEGIVSPSTSTPTIFIDTVNTRVDISTTGYGGSVANVGLFSSSNVVISTWSFPSVVLYSTGAVSIGTFTFTSPSPPDSKALCIIGGAWGHCTGGVSGSGGCTCVSP